MLMDNGKQVISDQFSGEREEKRAADKREKTAQLVYCFDNNIRLRRISNLDFGRNQCKRESKFGF